MATDTENRVSWLLDVPSGEMRRIVDALYRTHRLISVITDPNTLLETLTEETKQIAGAEACSLILYDPKHDDLYFHVALGESGDQQALKSKIRLRIGQGIAGQCAADRESINVPDAANDPRVFREADALAGFETRSLLAVPMVDRGELVGVLEVVNKLDGRGFTDVDRRIMEVFSSLAATVIANARLIEENLRTTRLAAIGQAVAGISHHTKNALAGLTSSVEIIDAGLSTKDMTMVQTGWGVLKRSVDRIESVVSDMLTYSKVRIPVRGDCDLRDLVDALRETFATQLERKQARFETDLVASRPVRLDRHGILRCLLNLVSNAIDAVPAGGGVVRVSSRMVDGDLLEIAVADNGPGVPEAAREAVFDPFYSTKGSQGTGLGLAVSLKIAEEHGGTIRIDASPEGGAEFVVTLPLHSEVRP